MPTTMSSTAFLQTIGIQTHLPYTDGAYFNTKQVLADLKYLGITQVRDGLSVNGGQSLASYETLASSGITFALGAGGSSTAAIQANLALIDTFARAAPGAVSAIEGLNEVNNWPITWQNGDTGLAAAVDAQKALVTGVRADSLLRTLPVYYFTGYGSGKTAGPDPVTAGLADYDNQHPYPIWGFAPGTSVSRASLQNTSSSSTPAVFTETGYSTNLTKTGQWGGVDQTVQAKYTLDLLFDAASAGISKTYLYELLDAYAPGSRQGDDGFGMFDYTGAPKLAATAIHNMTTILADPGASAPPASPTATLDYSLAGLTSTGRSMVLQQSDGSTVLALWAEPQIWNMQTQSEVAAPTQTVTLTLATPASRITVYDPLVGTSAIASAVDAGAITVGVTDHPVFIKISGTAEAGLSDADLQKLLNTESGPATLNFAQYTASTAALARLGSYQLRLSGVPVSALADVEKDSHIVAADVLDTAAHLGGPELALLGADRKVVSIKATDGAPIAVTSPQFSSSQAALAKLSGSTVRVSQAPVAALPALEANTPVSAVDVSDTGVMLGGSRLAKLGADAKVATVTVSDGKPINLSLADYTADAAGMAKLAPSAVVAVNASAVELTFDELTALGTDTKVASVKVTDPHTLAITAAQLAAPGAALTKVVAPSGLRVMDTLTSQVSGFDSDSRVTAINVVDTAQHLQASLPALLADRKVASVTVTDGQSVVQSYAQYASEHYSLYKLSNTSLNVVDVSASNAAAVARNSHVGSVAVAGAESTLAASSAADGLLADDRRQSVTLSVGQGSASVALQGSHLVFSATTDNHVTLGGEAETLAFGGPGFGHWTFSGFAANDRISFAKSLFASAGDVLSHVSGTTDALISDPRGDTILLKGVAPAEVTSKMLAFV